MQTLQVKCISEPLTPNGRESDNCHVFLKVIDQKLCVCVCLLGLLYPGDKLVEVNGQKVHGLQPELILQMLVKTSFVFLISFLTLFPLRNISDFQAIPYSYNDCIHSCSVPPFIGAISRKYYF